MFFLCVFTPLHHSHCKICYFPHRVFGKFFLRLELLINHAVYCAFTISLELVYQKVADNYCGLNPQRPNTKRNLRNLNYLYKSLNMVIALIGKLDEIKKNILQFFSVMVQSESGIW